DDTWTAARSFAALRMIRRGEQAAADAWTSRKNLRCAQDGRSGASRYWLLSGDGQNGTGRVDDQSKSSRSPHLKPEVRGLPDAQYQHVDGSLFDVLQYPMMRL